MSRIPFLRSQRTFVAGIGILLIVHAWVGLAASHHKSTTNDEIAHITSGYASNSLADFRVQPENGVLPQRWHAVPLVLANPAFPDLQGISWTGGIAFQLSYDFFYRTGNDPDQLLFWGRTMNVMWGWGVILLVAVFARHVAGNAAGLLAASIASLSPTLLAHSPLATSDMAMTFFFVAATGAFWWQTHHPGWRPLLLSALIFGLACVAKFSAVLLLPMLIILATLRVCLGPAVGGWRASADSRIHRIRTLGGSLLVHGVMAWLVIWAFFGFRFAMMSPDVPSATLPLPWDQVLSTHPAWEKLIFILKDFRVLPEAFLYGFSYVLTFSEARGTFLDGQLGTEGWFLFFPKAFLYKTPVAELLVLGVTLPALAILARQSPAPCRKIAYQLSPLIVLFAVYWASSLTTNLNIGHRHILPTYPLLWILSGILLSSVVFEVWRTAPRRCLVGVAGGCLMVQILSAVSIYPHYLAYFNVLSGGPEKGYQRLADSSLDWGQDLPGLGKWWRDQADHSQPLHLAYFGTGEPTAYGIDAAIISRLPTFNISRPWIDLRPGYYAISATMLQHVYRQKHQPWSAESEQYYQTLRKALPTMLAMQGDPAAHPELLDGLSAADWQHAWDVFEELRFARLCEYLKVRPPEAMIGYSILIFELDAEELDAAVSRDLYALVQAIERATQFEFAPETY